MPSSYVKELARTTDWTESDLEDKWEEAKTKAKTEGHTDDYAYITRIFQRLIGMTDKDLKNENKSSLFERFIGLFEDVDIENALNNEGNFYHDDLAGALIKHLETTGQITQDSDVQNLEEQESVVVNGDFVKFKYKDDFFLVTPANQEEKNVREYLFEEIQKYNIEELRNYITDVNDIVGDERINVYPTDNEALAIVTEIFSRQLISNFIGNKYSETYDGTRYVIYGLK